MNSKVIWMVGALASLVVGAAPGELSGLQDAQQVEGDSLAVWIWSDRGEETVVRPGDVVRMYYRTNFDGFAAVFRVDPSGRAVMMFPDAPRANARVSGGRDYRLLFPESPRWEVEDVEGQGHFFVIASPEPLDLSALERDASGSWALPLFEEAAFEDPYVAIDEHVLALLPDWERVPFALNLASYEVSHDAPAARRPTRVVRAPRSRPQTSSRVRVRARYGPVALVVGRPHYVAPPRPRYRRTRYVAPPPRVRVRYKAPPGRVYRTRPRARVRLRIG